MLSAKEKELLCYSIEYLLKAELNKEKWIEREDINTLNNLLSEIRNCKDILITIHLPKIEHKFRCGWKSSCVMQDYDNILEYNVCKTDDTNCMYLFPK